MSEPNLHGDNLFGEPIERNHASKLGDTFLIPPFSVLNAREGWWQERKRAWLALGIQSELGRGGALLEMSGQASEPGLNYYRKADAIPGGYAHDRTKRKA